MTEQLFTATGEAQGSTQKRMEQLFTARRGKKGNGKADRDREGRGLARVVSSWVRKSISAVSSANF
jgi:hypothetical protein